MSDRFCFPFTAFTVAAATLAICVLCGCEIAPTRAPTRLLAPAQSSAFIPTTIPVLQRKRSSPNDRDSAIPIGNESNARPWISRLPATDESGSTSPVGSQFVQLAAHAEPDRLAAPGEAPSALSPSTSSGGDSLTVESDSESTFPIDLANALALGGASSLQIQLARERVLEAEARYMAAKVMWLPSLRLGLGWTRHDGQLQATEGDVISAGHNSLFVGGGAGLGNAPLLGGSGGPPRMFVNLSIADAYFEPLATERMLAAEDAAESAGLNDALLEIAIAYFKLAEAYGKLSNATVALTSAQELINLTRLFAKEGAVSLAEVDRAETELAHWEQVVEETQRQALAGSAELVRLARLDPHLVLVPAEDQLMPITVVPADIHRDGLIAQGLTSRPELAEYSSIVDAALSRLQEEHWRPVLPHIQVGATGGTFGGGPSGTFADQKGRGDVELVAVWELKNLGAGNHAAIRQRATQMRQAERKAEMMRDKIVAEIVTSSSNVSSYGRQMNTTRRSVTSASASYERNLQRIREGEGIPLELLQALRARAAAQDAYTQAVTGYNRAQYDLLRAIGVPPGMPAGG